MNTISDLDHMTLNTRRREFDDGYVDFVVAGMVLLLTLLNWLIFSFTGIRWLVMALQWNRELTIIGLLALLPLFYLLIVGARKLVDRIRYRSLWKNSGSVKPLHWQVHWSTSLAAGLVFIVLIAMALFLMSRGTIDSGVVLRVLVSATGVATGVSYFGLGNEIKLSRYRWVGLAGMLLSIALMFVPLSFPVSWLVLGLVWGFVLAASGAWGLWKSFDSAKRN